MKQLKSKILSITLVLVIGVAGLGFATSASADAMYEASSYLSLTLTGVTDEWGNWVSPDEWSVYYENFFNDADTFTDGDGKASYDYTSTDGYLSVYDTVTVETSATGATGLGLAESYVETELALWADNWSDYDLLFSFGYSYYLSAAVGSYTNLDGDDALATADVDMIDDFSLFALESVTAGLLSGTLEDHLAYKGSFDFTLAGYDYNYISAIISSDGKAVGVAPVPEPGTMMLLGVGLAGLAATRLRKKSK